MRTAITLILLVLLWLTAETMAYHDALDEQCYKHKICGEME